MWDGCTASVPSQRPGQPPPAADDVRAHTANALENIKAIIEAGGSSLDHVLKVTAYLRDMNDYVPMNEVYRRHVGDRLEGGVDLGEFAKDTFEKKLEFDGKSYGPGDTVQARVEVSRWCADRGMTHYVYAPKDDPKHRERWREPYDAGELDGRELGACSGGELRAGPEEERDVRAEPGGEHVQSLVRQRLRERLVGQPKGRRGVRAAASQPRGHRDPLRDRHPPTRLDSGLVAQTLERPADEGVGGKPAHHEPVGGGLDLHAIG